MNAKENFGFNLENALNYKMSIDFSNLVSILSEYYKNIKKNKEDIISIRNDVSSLLNIKEESNKRIHNCEFQLNQASLTILKQNEKVMELETSFTKNVKEIKLNSEAIQTEFKKDLEIAAENYEKKIQNITEDTKIEIKKNVDIISKTLDNMKTEIQIEYYILHH